MLPGCVRSPCAGQGLWWRPTGAAFGPGLLMAGDGDGAEEKMPSSPHVSSWAFSLGRGV